MNICPWPSYSYGSDTYDVVGRTTAAAAAAAAAAAVANHHKP